MTEPELIEMMYESLGYADRNFEFWISASFGVILAFHFSGERVTTLMYRLIMFLYCSATVLFVSRWSVAALQYAQFRQELIDLGSSVKVSSLLMESVISVAYLLVIGIGTLGTIYFGRKATKKF